MEHAGTPAIEPTIDALVSAAEAMAPEATAPEAMAPEAMAPGATAAEASAVEDTIEPAAASAQSELPPPPAAVLAPQALPSSPPHPQPTATNRAAFEPSTAAASLPERIAALRARVAESVPPRWVEIARQYPVLWLVVAPVCLALLLILIVIAAEPERPAQAVQPKPALSSAPATQATVAPARAAPPASHDELDGAALAALESKPADSLSVQELLLLNRGRAQQKRNAARALSTKLHENPALIEDTSVQRELLRFAADPDTAAGALAAMAQARAPIGPDLLYEVWTNRAMPTGSAELAHALLYSRDVRPGASPALAVALELRGAEGCEAVQAALPKTQSEGDARALPSLIKLTSRRGCGAKKRDDCYACLRSQTKQIIASTKAAKERRAPSYPAP